MGLRAAFPPEPAEAGGLLLRGRAPPAGVGVRIPRQGDKLHGGSRHNSNELNQNASSFHLQPAQELKGVTGWLVLWLGLVAAARSRKQELDRGQNTSRTRQLQASKAAQEDVLHGELPRTSSYRTQQIVAALMTRDLDRRIIGWIGALCNKQEDGALQHSTHSSASRRRSGNSMNR
jgi:hypothetical protein